MTRKPAMPQRPDPVLVEIEAIDDGEWQHRMRTTKLRLPELTRLARQAHRSVPPENWSVPPENRSVPPENQQPHAQVGPPPSRDVAPTVSIPEATTIRDARASGGARRFRIRAMAGLRVVIVVVATTAMYDGGTNRPPTGDPPATVAQDVLAWTSQHPPGPPRNVRPPISAPVAMTTPDLRNEPAALRETAMSTKIAVERGRSSRHVARRIPKPTPHAQLSAAAHEEYATGNRRLFAGDARGALRAYLRAVRLGHVGGHRGVGIAHAQLGHDAKAIQALTTYLELAPDARDAALIEARIAALR